MMMQQKNDSGTVSAGFDSQHFSSRRELSCDSAMPTPPTASKREAATLKDLQKCGGYVYFLTVTYGMMVFSQTINLIFMTFAGELFSPLSFTMCPSCLELNGTDV